MAEIINLRRARKARDRNSAAETAARNRARFGRPKVERSLDEARARLENRKLEGHRLEQTSREDETDR